MLEYVALCNGWRLSIQYPNCHRFAILYPTAGLPMQNLRLKRSLSLATQLELGSLMASAH